MVGSPGASKAPGPRAAIAPLRWVTIVRPGEGRTPGQTLEVREGAIAAIGDTPAGSPTRFAGSFVVPGLIDMHVHYLPSFIVGNNELFSLLYLFHGVTSVRDVGSPDGIALSIRERTAGGDLMGPRVFSCGEMIDGNPAVWDFARSVETAEEARRAVREQAENGADCIKVYERITPEALRAVQEAAAEYDLRVIGHVPFAVPLHKSGISDIQHLTGVANLANPNYATWAEKQQAWFSMKEEVFDFVVQVSRDQGIAHTPTVVHLDHSARVEDYSDQPPMPQALLLPRFWRDVVWNLEYDVGWRMNSEEDKRNYKETYLARIELMKQLTRQLHEGGVTLHVGTDPMNPYVIPGLSVIEEMQILEETGIPLEDVWVAATSAPGASTGLPKLGRIEAGAPADFLILSEDPTVDLSAMDTLEAVVVDGRLYTKQDLDRDLRRYQDYFNGWIYDRTMTQLARIVMGSLEKGDDTPGDVAPSTAAVGTAPRMQSSK